MMISTTHGSSVQPIDSRVVKEATADLSGDDNANPPPLDLTFPDNDEEQDEGPSFTQQRSSRMVLLLSSCFLCRLASQLRRCNLNSLRTRAVILWSQLTWLEISGSFGDLGTLIPLVVALGQGRRIHVGSALLCAGVANVVTGWTWDVPMCVQPMKAIAAAAITEGAGLATPQHVTAAGLWMGISLVVLAETGTMEWIHRTVPHAVVTGMQLGVGLNLAVHGLETIAALPLVGPVDCLLLAGITALATLWSLSQTPTTSNNNRTTTTPTRTTSTPPLGLALLLVALILAIAHLTTQDLWPTSYDPSPLLHWTLSEITPSDWNRGFWAGALPQLPLTTLNSVISVCALAHTLYPEKRQPLVSSHNNDTNSMHNPAVDRAAEGVVLSRHDVALSVGLMNLMACPWGGLPSCHGAGGLAGQHKLGARHGASVVFLGSLKIVIALTLGQTLIVALLDAFPKAILGVMLTLAGQELALTGILSTYKGPSGTAVGTSSNTSSGSNEQQPQHEDETTSPPLQPPNEADAVKGRTTVALLTGVVILGLKKTHYGAIVGWIAHAIANRHQRTSCWRRRADAIATADHLGDNSGRRDMLAQPQHGDLREEQVPMIG